MDEPHVDVKARETRWNRSIASWKIETIEDAPGGIHVTLYTFSGEQVEFMMDIGKTTQFMSDLWVQAPHK